ncbi:hypothetical protein SCUCBS95973_008838 [Sporothrix curviconia]|uniref:Protein kinase domain-containing protein n=1 Tax=Sporothrix curviconia TaxID=1260050 RepID=A0ABP0CSX0_9PEZI
MARVAKQNGQEAAPVISLQQLRSFQKRLNHVFQAYRDGHENPLCLPQGCNDTYSDYLPYPSVEGGCAKVEHGLLRQAPRRRPSYRGRPYGVFKHRTLAAIDEVRRPRVINKLNSAARRLFGVGIRFRRVLNIGGMGLVALFEARNNSGLYNKCVAKIALERELEPQLAIEKSMMRLFHGAPHIVQQHTIDELRALPGGRPSSPVQGELPSEPPQLPPQIDMFFQDLVEGPSDVLLLEYLPDGSLDHWIAKAVELGVPFSNETCWRMLHCLAKGCLAMKYPPASHPTAAGLPVETELRELATKTKDNDSMDVDGYPPCMDDAGVIHLDLDPTNILVDTSGLRVVDATSSSSSRGHTRVPKLKVSDFGLAVERTQLTTSAVNTWDVRPRGKLDFYLPEQWTAEWDAVKDHPSHEGALVAGQYSERSNVYHAGAIMLAVILRIAPLAPFSIQPVVVRNWEHPAYPAGMHDTGAFMEKYGSSSIRTIQTLAWPLDEQPYTTCHEWRLRELIMRCAAYMPSERPSAGELLRLVEGRLKEGFSNDEAAKADENISASSLFTAENMPGEPLPERAYNDLYGAIGARPSEAKRYLPQVNTIKKPTEAFWRQWFQEMAVQRSDTQLKERNEVKKAVRVPVFKRSPPRSGTDTAQEQQPLEVSLVLDTPPRSESPERYFRWGTKMSIDESSNSAWSIRDFFSRHEAGDDGRITQSGWPSAPSPYGGFSGPLSQ